MKFGLISDLHGDPEAVQLAINMLREKGVDQILCAGDYVERGPKGDEAVAVAKAEGVIGVAGNHDLVAAKNMAWYKAHGDQFNLNVTNRMLSDETVEFLANLPKTKVIPAGDQCILLAHGTPWSDTTYLFPGTRRDVFEKVAKAAKADNAGYVILGHTHVPMRGQIDGVHILNPGSVCGTFTSGSQTCAVLTLPDFNFVVYEIMSGTPVRVARPVDEYEIME